MSDMPELTKEQLALIHILADYFEGHKEWHTLHEYVGCTHKCTYCETLNDLELYIQARVERSKR